jgi:hypothetical protein
LGAIPINKKVNFRVRRAGNFHFFRSVHFASRAIKAISFLHACRTRQLQPKAEDDLLCTSGASLLLRMNHFFLAEDPLTSNTREHHAGIDSR